MKNRSGLIKFRDVHKLENEWNLIMQLSLL